MNKYQIPETYEEAVKRKAYVLEQINKYNEALFSEQELPFTDEEIEDLQEEYQILNDHLALTKEEKLNKLNDSDKMVLEDGTVVEKQSIFDKIHWSFYIYTIISTFLVSGVLSNSVGRSLFSKYLENILKKIVDQGVPASEAFNPVLYWLVVVGCFFFIPLLIVLISTGLYFVYKRINQTNKKAMFILLMVHIVIAIIAMTILGIKNYDDITRIYEILGQIPA